MECPVMKVKDSNETGFKHINVEDFDEAIHEVFIEADPDAEAKLAAELKVKQEAEAAEKLKMTPPVTETPPVVVPPVVATTPAAGAAAVKPAWTAKKPK